MLVFAYERGGAGEAGAAALAQLIPSIVLAPMITAHANRIGFVRLLVSAYAGQALFLAACAVAIVDAAPTPVVLACAAGMSVLLGVSRPMHTVMMPLVVQHPEELTAANVATSWSDSLGYVAGPLLAGVLIAADGTGLALGVLAAIAVAMPVLASVRAVRTSRSSPTPDEESGEGGFHELIAAARAIAARPTHAGARRLPRRRRRDRGGDRSAGRHSRRQHPDDRRREPRATSAPRSGSGA